jgi:hypothetical protein
LGSLRPSKDCNSEPAQQQLKISSFLPVHIWWRGGCIVQHAVEFVFRWIVLHRLSVSHSFGTDGGLMSGGGMSSPSSMLQSKVNSTMMKLKTASCKLHMQTEAQVRPPPHPKAKQNRKIESVIAKHTANVLHDFESGAIQ